MSKLNDWIIAGITNPNTNVGEFKLAGYNLSNTLMLPKSEYLKSDYIKSNPMFADLNGNFSQYKFDDYYNSRLQELGLLSQQEKTFEYDPFDIMQYRDDNAIIRLPKSDIYKISNPNETTIGSGFINEEIASPFSDRERAQRNKVFDYTTKQFLEYSPNDHALFSNPLKWFKDIFKEPLVLATYDSDGVDIDPVTGMPFRYTKGQKKLNADGKYYYETLGGRSLAGKQVLSGFDTLTADGSGLNKIDPFDGDDIEKSITSTITRGAIALAPIFIGGYVGTAYTAAIIAREMMKTLPMIDGMSYMISPRDNEDSSFTRFANYMAGKAKAATLDVSDYSKENTISLENLTNLVVDVALQWNLQKKIGEAIRKLSGAKKLEKEAKAAAFNKWKEVADTEREKMIAQGVDKDKILATIGDANTWEKSSIGLLYLNNAFHGMSDKIETLTRLGLDASLVYMALISNPDVYEQMLEHGTTKREAAIVTLASTLGMFYVDKKLHLGEMFFDDTDFNQAARRVWQSEKASFVTSFAKAAKNDIKNDKKHLKLFSEAYLKAKNLRQSFWEGVENHSLNAAGKAFGEGLEEVSEELASDISKQLYEWAAQIAPIDNFFNDLTTDNVNAFDNAFEDPDWVSKMMTRYGMNFLGGFIGGGIFYGKEVYDGREFNKKFDDADLMHMTRKYGADRMLKSLEKAHKKGLASKDLSIVVGNPEADADQRVFLPVSDGLMSQNDFIYEILKHEIQQIDNIVKNNEHIVSDDELLSKMTLGELRFMTIAQALGDDFSSGMLKRYEKLVDDYINVSRELKRVIGAQIDSEKNNLPEEKEQYVKKLEKRKKELEQALDDFTSVDNAIDYTASLIFRIDENVSKHFFDVNFETWLNNVHRDGADGSLFVPMTILEFEKLPLNAQEKIREQYAKYKINKQEEDFEVAWSNFKLLRDKINPELQDIIKKLPEYDSYLKDRDLIFSQIEDFKKVLKQLIQDLPADSDLLSDWDKLLYFEPDANYAFRDIKLDEETPEAFEKRQKKRREFVASEKIYQKILDLFKQYGGLIDRETKRQLLLYTGVDRKSVIRKFIDTYQLPNLEKSLRKDILNLLELISPDMSNFEDYEENGELRPGVGTQILELLKSKYQEDVTNDVDNTVLKFVDLFDFLQVFYDDENNNFGISDLTYDDFRNAINNENQKRLNTISLIRKYLGLNDSDEITTDNLNNLLSVLLKSSDKFAIENLSVLSDKLKEDLIQDLANAGFDFKGKPHTVSNVKKYLNSGNNLTIFKSIIDNNNELSNIFYNIFDGIEYNETDLDDIIKRQFSESDLIDFSKITTKEKFSYKDFLEHLSNIAFTEDGKLQLSINPETNQYNLMGLDFLRKFSKSELDKLSNDVIQGFFDMFNGNILVGSTEMRFDDIFDDYGDPKDIIDPSTNELTEPFDKSYGISLALKEIQSRLQTFSDTVHSNNIFNFINEIEKLWEVENPVMLIAEKLQLFVDPSSTYNIRELLDKLWLSFLTKTYTQFTLTPQERNLLNEAEQILNIALMFLYAAYSSEDYLNPYPHNQLLNQLIEKYGAKNTEKQVVIDDKLGLLYNNSIQQLLNIIGVLNTGSGEFTPGSFRDWDKRNLINKERQYIESRQANIKSKIDFWSTEDKVFVLEDGTNLLDGIENISSSDDDDDVKLYKIENLFCDNVYKYLNNKKITLSKLFDLTKIKLLWFDDIASKLLYIQETSTLNEHTKYAHWTINDKLRYILETICISSKEFVDEQSSFSAEHSDLAALDIQLQVSRAGLAYINLTELFLSGLNWIINQYESIAKQKPGLNESNKFGLYSVFVPGNGGAGKTEVVISLQVDFALKKGKANESIILTGPTPKQEEKLKVLKKGNVLSLTTILKLILGDNYNDFINDTLSTDPQSYRTLDNKKFGSAKIKKSIVDKFKDAGYSIIIMDEATHVSTYVHSVLSAYAKKFHIPLILVGDNYQDGFYVKENEVNINPEKVFVMRTQRLDLTLRDGNILKYTNLMSLTNLLKISYLIGDDALRILNIKNFLNQVRLLHLFYYNKDDINGDLVTQTIDDDILRKMTPTKKKEHFIAYVGSDATVIEKIKNIHGDNSVDEYKTIKEIQGSEFDYIITDHEFNIPDLSDISKIDSNKFNEIHGETEKFLKELYTLSSRAKKGAIFIDKNENLKKAITFSLDPYKNDLTNFDENAIKSFNKSYALFYEKVKEVETPLHVSQVMNNDSGFQIKFELAQPSKPIDTEEMSIEQEDLPQTEEDKDADDFLEDLTDEQMQKIGDDFELQELQALIYGENTLSGMPFIIKNIEYITQNGTFQKSYRTYTFEGLSRNVLYDLEAFIFNSGLNLFEYIPKIDENGNKIGGSHLLTPYVTKLKKFKLHILTRYYYDEDEFSDLISEEDYNKILSGENVKIEISKYNDKRDNFVGLSQLSDAQEDMEISPVGNKDKLIYKIIAEFQIPNSGGKIAKITLGMFANPLRFNYLAQDDSDLRKKVERRIERLKQQLKTANEQFAIQQTQYQITKSEKFLELLKSLSLSYSDKILQLYDKYNDYVIQKRHIPENEGYVDMELQTLTLNLPGDVIFTGNTEIRTIIKNLYTVGRMRLSNLGIQEPEDFSFKDLNKDVYLSRVYCYTGDMPVLKSIRGKCVIFASIDPAFANNTNRLIERWVQELNRPGKHSVVMLRLDNMGCSLSLLATPKTRNQFRTQSGTEEGGDFYFNSLPFEGEFMGIRQVVNLWNFRASILNFIDEFNKSKLSSINRDIIYKELIRQHEFYRTLSEKGLATDEKNFRTLYLQYLDELGINKLLASDIFDFNDGLAKTKTEIRLGVGNITPVMNPQTNKVRNSWQIRKLTNIQKDDFYYKENNEGEQEDVYGIYLTPDTAYDYQRMLNLLFDKLTNGFKLIFEDENGDKDERSYVTNLSTGELNISGNVTNILYRNKETPIKLLRDENNEILVEDDAKLLKQIPQFIVTLATRAIGYSKTIIQDNKRIFPNEGVYQNRTRTVEWRDRQINPYHIHRYKKNEEGRLVRDKELKDIVIGTQDLYQYGQDLIHMLELCFHGTTDDFIGALIRSRMMNQNVTPQSVNAMFKKGFLSDPLIERGKTIKSDDGNKTIASQFAPLLTAESNFSVAAMIDLPKFFITWQKKTLDNAKTQEQLEVVEEEKLNAIEQLRSINNKAGIEGFLNSRSSFNELIPYIKEQTGLLLLDVNTYTFTQVDDRFVLDIDNNNQLIYDPKSQEFYIENIENIEKLIRTYIFNRIDDAKSDIYVSLKEETDMDMAEQKLNEIELILFDSKSIIDDFENIRNLILADLSLDLDEDSEVYLFIKEIIDDIESEVRQKSNC